MRASLSATERRRLLAEGLRLLSEGRFFEAHEAFEDLWSSTDHRAERDLWQGLAQVCAALVKHDRSEPATAISLLAKATRRLEASPLLTLHAGEVKGWLDGLAGPITSERELGDPSLPGDLAARLELLVSAGPDDAAGGGLS